MCPDNPGYITKIKDSGRFHSSQSRLIRWELVLGALDTRKRSIHAKSVITRQLARVILEDTIKHYIYEWNIHVGNLITSTHAGNVTIRCLSLEVSLNTIVQYMKGESTHTGNVTKMQLQRIISLDISESTTWREKRSWPKCASNLYLNTFFLLYAIFQVDKKQTSF